MTQFTARAVQTVKKWLMVKCSEMKQNCKNLYSKAFVLDPDGDYFSVVQKMEQFCGKFAKLGNVDHFDSYFFNKLIKVSMQKLKRQKALFVGLCSALSFLPDFLTRLENSF